MQGETFEMGDHFIKGRGDVLPVDTVTLNSLCIGYYKVTQNEYEAMLGNNHAIMNGK